MNKIIVTGAAGFIGYHLSERLLNEGFQVVGIDNLNDYYDTSLKESRLRRLQRQGFSFVRAGLENREAIEDVFRNGSTPAIVVHLAAQAGVRYSLTHPEAYIDSNIVGFLNVLEACRLNGTEHLIYASSSSVYGKNTKLPFSTSDNVNHPVSLYAATKKANELMAHSYSHLFGIRTTGLRFFTVYGPWGRPDMALFLFTKSILNGEPLQVFNGGSMLRDFTYIDDIVESVYRIIVRPDSKSADRILGIAHQHNYSIYNIGNNAPVKLMDFIEAIEDKLGIKAKKQLLPLQAGDVPNTYADVSDLYKHIGFKPQTSIKDGVGHFVDWYKNYYEV